MAAARTSIGFRAVGRSATYDYKAENPSYNPDTNTVSVDITGQRSGDLYTDATATMFANGQQIAQTSLGTPRSSFFGSLGSLSGAIPNPNGSVTITIEITLDAYDGDGSMDFTVDTAPPIDSSLVSSSCSADTPSNPSPGDQITLEGTVNNDNSAPVDVEVGFSFGGATETQTITVPAGDQEMVTQTFTPDETGEFDPDVDHTIL